MLTRAAAGRAAAASGVAAATAAAGWTAWHVTSPLVRGWSPGAGTSRLAGPLSVRVLPPAPGVARRPVVVLLHGLVASGTYFGGGFDALAAAGHPLVVPDLLGFGRSRSRVLEEPSDRYALPAHLDALDAAAADLGLDDGPLVVAGHSFGALVAVAWAARRAGEVARVVALSAPLYDGPAEAGEHLRGLGLLHGVMATGGTAARASCWVMWRRRRAGAALAVALSAGLPVPVALDGVQHTWPAYDGALRALADGDGWQGPLGRLADAGVPVLLAHGDRDPVVDRRRAARLSRAFASVAEQVVPGVGHHLPLHRADTCHRAGGPGAVPG